MRFDLQPLRLLALLVCFGMFFSPTLSWGQSPAAAMIKLLQSGRVPEQRLPSIVKLVCERGNGDDLNYIFSEVLKENHWNNSLRAVALTEMAIAAAERKTIPTGDVSGLKSLIASDDPAIRRAAIDLADDWNAKNVVPQLVEVAQSKSASSELRQRALTSLLKLSPEESRTILTQLATAGDTFELKALAISVLTKLDTAAAAKLTSELLKHAEPEDDLTPLLVAFLDLNQGSKVLASQLQVSTPSRDVARLLLRQMYAMGRTDPELNQILSRLAGMNQAVAPPTKEEVAALVKEVAEHGNPQRGEEVFRRKDLSCLNCHAVSKGGGQIGPDLSAIGASSPMEYLVTSVLDPDQAIKEAFISKTILTSDGMILQGIVADRTKDALVLKDATGKKVSVPLDDIEDEVEGKSLMPKGLVNFMTHAELLDLISFLSELGKPGEYAVRSNQRMQRYRVLNHAPESVLEQVPTMPVFESAVAQANTWEPTYAKVNGDLPLEQLASQTRSKVLYVRGDVSCSESGAVELKLNSTDGVTAWFDLQEVPLASGSRIDLAQGEHSIILRIDLETRKEPMLRLEVEKPADSAAEFVVVDGQ